MFSGVRLADGRLAVAANSTARSKFVTVLFPGGTYAEVEKTTVLKAWPINIRDQDGSIGGGS